MSCGKCVVPSKKGKGPCACCDDNIFLGKGGSKCFDCQGDCESDCTTEADNCYNCLNDVRYLRWFKGCDYDAYVSYRTYQMWVKYAGEKGIDANDKLQFQVFQAAIASNPQAVTQSHYALFKRCPTDCSNYDTWRAYQKWLKSLEEVVGCCPKPQIKCVLYALYRYYKKGGKNAEQSQQKKDIFAVFQVFQTWLKNIQACANSGQAQCQAMAANQAKNCGRDCEPINCAAFRAYLACVREQNCGETPFNQCDYQKWQCDTCCDDFCLWKKFFCCYRKELLTPLFCAPNAVKGKSQEWVKNPLYFQLKAYMSCRLFKRFKLYQTWIKTNPTNPDRYCEFRDYSCNNKVSVQACTVEKWRNTPYAEDYNELFRFFYLIQDEVCKAKGSCCVDTDCWTSSACEDCSSTSTSCDECTSTSTSSCSNSGCSSTSSTRCTESASGGTCCDCNGKKKGGCGKGNCQWSGKGRRSGRKGGCSDYTNNYWSRASCGY